MSDPPAAAEMTTGRRRRSPEQLRDLAAVGAGWFGLIYLIGTLVNARDSLSWGYDFRAYYMAAARWLHDGGIYLQQTLSGPFRPGPGGLYMYSPVPAVVVAPVVALPFDVATVLWVALRVALLALTCALLPVSMRIKLALFFVASVTYPIQHDLVLGNVSLIVTFFGAVAWRYLDRPLGSIAVAASMTLRAPMGLFIGWWLLRGRWPPAIWCIVTGAVIVLASLPFVGIENWIDYVRVLRNLSDITGVPRNRDLGSLVLAFGGAPIGATVALFAGYVTAIVAMILSLRRDRELSFIVTLGATLLVSPLLWDHYLTNLLLPAAFLASRSSRWWLALPLLGLLPGALIGLAAVAGLLAPFAAPDRGEPAGNFLNRTATRRAPVPA